MLDTVALVALVVDDDNDYQRKQGRRRSCDNDWDVVRDTMGDGE